MMSHHTKQERHPVRITIGKCDFEYPSDEVRELRDSNDILHNAAALRARIAEDGYLLIRGLHERERVLAAGRVLLRNLQELGSIKPGTNLDDAYISAPDAKGGFKGGRKAVSHEPDMLRVLEGEPVFAFFERFFEEPVRTFDYKWIRAVRPGESTGSHYDVVYMGRGSGRLHTIWTPLCDVPIKRGPLALCLGSHSLPGFEKVRQTYGKMDVDNDKVQGWFSDDPRELSLKFGGQWATTEFQAGDVLIFGMYTMHGSVRNDSEQFRLSADTRFQPASDPVDERWIGDNPIAHYGWNIGETVTMADARAKWGV